MMSNLKKLGRRFSVCGLIRGPLQVALGHCRAMQLGITLAGSFILLLLSSPILSKADTVPSTTNTANRLSFYLSGGFEDTINGAHHNGGLFTVGAFKSSAMVDMSFESQYRELAGTDGQDSFWYVPFTNCPTCQAAGSTNGQAIISHGRFPISANFMLQVLWMATTHEPTLTNIIQTNRFPFCGVYQPEQLSTTIVESTNPPFLPISIKWYAPNYVQTGTNRYKSADYPDGYLVAALSSEMQNVGTLSVPAAIHFTVYAPTTTTNPAQINQLLEQKGPDAVSPIETMTFTISSALMTKRFPTYIPMVPDKTARVNDLRTKFGWTRVESGKWWTAGQIYKKEQTRFNHGRLAIITFILMLAALPLFLLLGSRQKNPTDRQTQTNANQ